MLYGLYFALNMRTPYNEEREEFANLQAVKDTLWRRMDDRYYVMPGTDQEFLVYTVDPAEYDDAAPEWRVFFGPREGIRHERV